MIFSRGEKFFATSCRICNAAIMSNCLYKAKKKVNRIELKILIFNTIELKIR